MASSTAVPSDVRTWAVENGFDVGSRGRFSAELIAAYNKAHPRKKYVAPSEA